MPMNHDPIVYGYRIVRDYGFAPNPFGGYCTLACCKPDLRKVARPGDLIIGFAGVAIRAGRVIFAMRVQENLTFQQYWEDPRFVLKRPSDEGGLRCWYGDNIYSPSDDGSGYQQLKSHHSFADGSTNASNRNTDLRFDSVLVSDDFVYFGGHHFPRPALLDHLYGNQSHGRGRPRHVDGQEAQSIFAWYESLAPNGMWGLPSNWSIDGDGRDGEAKRRRYRYSLIKARECPNGLLR